MLDIIIRHIFIQKLRKCQFKMFDIFINGHSWFEQLSPSYVKTNTIYSRDGFSIADTKVKEGSRFG